MAENRSEKQALITRPEDVQRIAATLAKETIIAVDTEFIRETTFFPQIALIQVATREESWLVDPVALDKQALQPLLDVFTHPGVTKVFHAAFADQECFYWEYGILAEPVFDTSVAAALAGLGDNAGLGKLLREILGINVPKGRARAKWLARPLSPELLNYAREDVSHLVELGMQLKDRLEKRNRWDWVMEESRLVQNDFDPSAEEMASRMGKNLFPGGPELAALVELVAWREDRARSANLPRNWVADNETLIALAKTRPRNLQELRSFRGLHAKEVERSGERILSAIEAGRKKPSTPGSLPRGAPLSESEEHVVDFIQTYVKYLAAQNEIASRYLLSSAKATRLYHARKGGITEWVRDGILSNRAAQLVGDELVALLGGHRALGLKDGRVQIVPLGG